MHDKESSGEEKPNKNKRPHWVISVKQCSDRGPAADNGQRPVSGKIKREEEGERKKKIESAFSSLVLLAPMKGSHPSWHLSSVFLFRFFFNLFLEQKHNPEFSFL